MSQNNENSEFEALLEGMNQALDYARGDRDGFRAHVPDIVDVPAIRASTGLTQKDFAALFGIGVATLRQWEQGRRSPRGPARVLLRIIDREPEVVLRILHDTQTKAAS